MMRNTRMILLAGLSVACAHNATADDLFKNKQWAGVATDRRSSQVGDILTIVVYQSAEARNAAENASRRERSVSGRMSTDVKTQEGEVSLGGDYSGRGEVRRSESFATQISVTIREVHPNGDYGVAGEQTMSVNGETTRISVRGRVRPVDIGSDNRVISSRIADAEINYNGEGFVSRNSQSGPLDWIFNLLGFSG